VNCRLCDISAGAKLFGQRLKQTANLMIGVPDYDTYVQHRTITHPDLPVMTREEFFRASQDRRYGGSSGGAFRCC
jgi:uncharacterized short protein YbdD (DUF466 family)